MSESIQAIHYITSDAKKEPSFDIESINYDTKESIEGYQDGVSFVDYSIQKFIEKDDLNNIKFIAFASEESECRNTLFYYL